MPLIAGAAVAVLVIGGIVLAVTRKSSPTTPATGSVAAVTSSVIATPATTSTIVPAGTATTGTVATSAQPTLDPSLVDKEVQRRLDEERRRLEAQARAQGTPAETPAATRPVPAPTPQVVQQTPAPVQQPPQENPRPVPAPVQQAPEPVAETRPAPTQPAASEQRAREGDLVAAGTEGLTAPRVVRRGTVTYPAVARMQKIQGTVITSVLVSESGQVLEVRILRGVNRPVGLNEAAEQAMRRSTFAPATKDGVRVRSWVTVPVEFKL
jgi:protein TonB